MLLQIFATLNTSDCKMCVCVYIHACVRGGREVRKEHKQQRKEPIMVLEGEIRHSHVRKPGSARIVGRSNIKELMMLGGLKSEAGLCFK